MSLDIFFENAIRKGLRAQELVSIALRTHSKEPIDFLVAKNLLPNTIDTTDIDGYQRTATFKYLIEQSAELCFYLVRNRATLLNRGSLIQTLLEDCANAHVSKLTNPATTDVVDATALLTLTTRQGYVARTPRDPNFWNILWSHAKPTKGSGYQNNCRDYADLWIAAGMPVTPSLIEAGIRDSKDAKISRDQLQSWVDACSVPIPAKMITRLTACGLTYHEVVDLTSKTNTVLSTVPVEI